MRQRVFIVHGHDKEPVKALEELITTWGLEAIVLSRLPDSGLTIIEKFERYARTCDFAIILLTPDDKNADELDASQKFRARQNVIFEMGWFFSFLRRDGTLLLYKDNIELPSDVTGILYKKFAHSPVEKASEIRRALQLGGVRVPEPEAAQNVRTRKAIIVKQTKRKK